MGPNLAGKLLDWNKPFGITIGTMVRISCKEIWCKIDICDEGVETLVRKAVLFDFDGTITMKDTSELVLRRFAEGDWESYDQAMDKGMITLEQCMVEQFKLVKTKPEEIIDYLNGVVQLRPGFDELLLRLRKSGYDTALVSAGLDFVIKHYLSRFENLGEMRIVCGKTSYNGHIDFRFPRIVNGAAANFKHDLVIEYTGSDTRVIYVGDGSSDYFAARASDFCFPVKGSRLEKMCISENIEHFAFEKFDDISDKICEFI